MVLGFKPQFVPKILDGTKKHTIREDKSNRWREGLKMQMATGVRTKNYNQFYEDTCVGVLRIVIRPFSGMVYIDTKDASLQRLTKEEIEQLAINDGFDSVAEFWNWFNKDFDGRIIFWKETPLLTARREVVSNPMYDEGSKTLKSDYPHPTKEGVEKVINQAEKIIIGEFQNTAGNTSDIRLKVNSESGPGRTNLIGGMRFENGKEVICVNGQKVAETWPSDPLSDSINIIQPQLTGTSHIYEGSMPSKNTANDWQPKTLPYAQNGTN